MNTTWTLFAIILSILLLSIAIETLPSNGAALALSLANLAKSVVDIVTAVKQ